jgi:cyclase
VLGFAVIEEGRTVFTEEAPGVFSVDSRFVEGKNGVVVGSRGAAAIDGSNFPDEGEAMADFISSRGHPVDRLVLTHGHGDHILGAGPLAGGEVYAHTLTPGVISAQLAGWADRWEISRDEAGERVVCPTVTFTDELRIDLGGKHLWMFPTPGHSEDGVSVLVEEDRLLFAGDSVVTGIVPAIGNGDSRVLERSLERLVSMDIEILVPGHGQTLHGSNRVKDWLIWQKGYLTRVRERVQALLNDGVDGEDVPDLVDFDELIEGRLSREKHGMPKRHKNTIQKITQEISQTQSP